MGRKVKTWKKLWVSKLLKGSASIFLRVIKYLRVKGREILSQKVQGNEVKELDTQRMNRKDVKK